VEGAGGRGAREKRGREVYRRGGEEGEGSGIFKVTESVV